MSVGVTVRALTAMLMTLLATTTFLFPTAVAQTDLIKNGDFSYGLNYWNVPENNCMQGVGFVTFACAKIVGHHVELYESTPLGGDAGISQNIQLPLSVKSVVLSIQLGTIPVAPSTSISRMSVIFYPVDHPEEQSKLETFSPIGIYVKSYDITPFAGTSLVLLITGNRVIIEKVSVIVIGAETPPPGWVIGGLNLTLLISSMFLIFTTAGVMAAVFVIVRRYLNRKIKPVDKTISQTNIYAHLDHLHFLYSPENGDLFRLISRKLDTHFDLHFGTLNAEKLHIEWHKIRNINIPKDTVLFEDLEHYQS